MTMPAGFGDEAARLLTAMEGWLRTASSASPAAASSGVVRELLGGTGEHRCESPCQLCPVCQLISAARNVRPDVVEHLAEAIGSVVLAFRAFTEPAPGPGPAADADAAADADRPAEPPRSESAAPSERALTIVVQHIPIH